MTVPVRWVYQRSTVAVKPGTNFGVHTTPAVHETESSGCSVGLLVKTTFCSGSLRAGFSEPSGKKIGTGGPPNDVGKVSNTGVRAEVGLPKSSISDGSRKPLPIVERMVSDSSIGCH